MMKGASTAHCIRQVDGCTSGRYKKVPTQFGSEDRLTFDLQKLECTNIRFGMITRLYDRSTWR